MILLKNLISETYGGGHREEEKDIYEIQDEVQQEFHSGKTYQSWRLIPAKLLKLTWLTFAKYGRVNEKALDKIWEITKENVMKILLNTDIQQGYNPSFFYKDDCDEITEEEWDRWYRFVSDRSGSQWVRNTGEVEGNARYSDRSRSLYKLVAKAYKSETPEELLVNVDQILNFVHGLGDMAKWFVEGGVSSLEDISTAPVKGIHLTGQLRENVFYRGENDSGKKIDEPFTVAKELGAIFASENPVNAKLYGPKITKFVAKPGTKILRYDKPEFWSLLGRKRPPNNWIGSVAKHGKEKLIDVVNLLTSIAHKRGYDAVVFSPTDDIGTMIFNPNAFEIHRSTPINERTFDLKNKDDAAEHIIRQVWRFIPQGEDRYDSNDVLMWLSNEYELHNEAGRLAQQFYPDDDEPLYRFHDDIERVLHKMEAERLQRKQKRTPSLKDPLYVLKKLMVGTSWKQAKNRISKLALHGGFGKLLSLSDEDVEEVFQRLFRNAMGETYYSKEEFDKYGFGPLSKLKYKGIQSSNEDPVQYTIDIFLRHYFGIHGPPQGKVKVWRGTNNPHAGIRPGDFVTFDRGYAQNYMRGKWKTIATDEINASDLIAYRLEPGRSELVYWPEGHQIQKYTGEIPSFQDFWQQYRFGI